MEGPRACRPEELPGLRRLVDRVFRPGSENSLVDEFPILFNEANCRHLRVMLEDGRPVSCINYVVRPVVIYGNLLVVGSLGAVSTYEEYRGRGLATTLLEDTFAEMREEKVDVVLISGQRGLYQRAGCAIGGHEMRFSLDRQALERVEAGHEVTLAEASDADIPNLIAIHQTEPARYIRSPWDWEQFLKVCRLVPKGVEPPFGVRRCWLVASRDRPLGYVVLAVAPERSAPTAGVVEFGGSRWAVIAALRVLAERYGLQAISVRVLPEDREALAILGALGVAAELHSLGGHRLAILHEDILSRYLPWLTERVGPEAAAAMQVRRYEALWLLEARGKAVPVGDFEALNAALFGDTVRDLAGDGEAIELLRQALPLPWVLPGLNYI